MSVSIFIQTLDEERNLPGLLESVEWADDIVVLDSLSTDDTRRVAEQAGCRWFERAFDGRGPHQNWAMENIDFKHPWVFYLDADERMTPALRAEIEQIAARPLDSGPVAYTCGRENYFMGKWLKHAMPPGRIMRFFRPEKIRFERLANPAPIVDGDVGHLRARFLHYNFSKGVREWIERHNRYSTFEAIETLRALADRPVSIKRLLSTDATTRRLELKNLSFRLPLRPALKFVYMFLLKGGFLDGRAGLVYCRLQAMYEQMIVMKVRERRRALRMGIDPDEHPGRVHEPARTPTDQA